MFPEPLDRGFPFSEGLDRAIKEAGGRERVRNPFDVERKEERVDGFKHGSTVYDSSVGGKKECNENGSR